MASKEAESTVLEFKGPRIFDGEIDGAVSKLSRGVSAFANSIGGHIVIGIEATKSTDLEGSAAASLSPILDRKYRAEWLAQKLASKITPPIPDVDIFEVSNGSGGWCIVLSVGQSSVGPHQASDHKYYARRQYQNIPMQHWEIDDIRRRNLLNRPDVHFGFIFSQRVLVEISIHNRSEEAITDIHFELPPGSETLFDIRSPALRNGITILNPGEQIAYPIGDLHTLFTHPELKNDTSFAIVYKDWRQALHRQFAVLNLANHDFSSFLRSDVDLLSDHVRRGFKELTEAVKALKGSLERTLGPLTANSGIAFSVDTIAEIRGIMQGNIHNAKRNASGLSPEGIQEIVRCDLDSAYALFRYLTMMGLQAESLDDVDRIEPDLREIMRKALYSLDKKL